MAITNCIHVCTYACMYVCTTIRKHSLLENKHGMDAEKCLLQVEDMYVCLCVYVHHVHTYVYVKAGSMKSKRTTDLTHTLKEESQ